MFRRYKYFVQHHLKHLVSVAFPWTCILLLQGTKHSLVEGHTPCLYKEVSLILLKMYRDKIQRRICLLCWSKIPWYGCTMLLVKRKYDWHRNGNIVILKKYSTWSVPEVVMKFCQNFNIFISVWESVREIRSEFYTIYFVLFIEAFSDIYKWIKIWILARKFVNWLKQQSKSRHEEFSKSGNMRS